jgi:ribonucleotide reductase alpha subunit
MNTNKMTLDFFVVKRNGKKQEINFEKITKRLMNLSYGLDPIVDITLITQKAIQGVYCGIKTSELDTHTAQLAASMITKHPDYGILASRIEINNLHKNTEKSFSKAMEILHEYKKPKSNNKSPKINSEFYKIVCENADVLDGMIVHNNDTYFTYFAFKTLEKSYLLKVDDLIVETPQFMFLRVAVCIHGNNIPKVKETYNLLSSKKFIHATPTLFNAGTINQQLSSCYILTMKQDSIDGIYDTLKDCAIISKHAGGIGINVNSIRSKNSFIAGTNGYSNGIVPMLRVFNNTARYVDQGGNKRPGAFAVYLEPWHSDIFEFIKLKSASGDGNLRALDLFYGMWIPDLFMKRVESNGMWSLFSPNNVPLLNETYGDEFEKLYETYEKEELYTKQIEAKTLWYAILDSQMETGTPYMLYKDNVNHKTNQKNIGIIRSSNLCCVSPETKVLTDKGDIEISTLKDQVVNVWNGQEFSEVTVRQTSECDELMKVGFDFGDGEKHYLECTLKHDFYVDRESLIYKIQARDLRVDDEIEMYKLSDGITYIIQVNSLERTKRMDKTFCFNEPKRHRGVFNGVLTGQCEIMEYTSPEETAVCNLASLSLPSYVLKPIPYDIQIEDVDLNEYYDFKELHRVTKIVAENLNNVIDINYYPIPETKKSNLSHRPIGIGVQGLADTFFKLRLGFDSLLARRVNSFIFETMYHAALEKSCELSQRDTPYSTFKDSPASKGILQYDMWNARGSNVVLSGMWDFDTLKNDIQKHGLRNSLLLAPMPTASTGQILNNVEAFEPINSNMYGRKVLSGEFQVVNKHLLRELVKLGIWNETVRQQMFQDEGSIQKIKIIPDNLKFIYRTVWEISQKSILEMAADRGAFIDQSQSMNVFIASPNYKTLTSMHFYGWKLGLKTGMYYLRSKSGVEANKVTTRVTTQKEEEDPVCLLDEFGRPDPACLSCSG